MPSAREAFGPAGHASRTDPSVPVPALAPQTPFERASRAAVLAGDAPLPRAAREAREPAGEGGKEAKGKGRDKGKAKAADPNQRSLVSYWGSSAAKAAEEKAQEDPVPTKCDEWDRVWDENTEGLEIKRRPAPEGREACTPLESRGSCPVCQQVCASLPCAVPRRAAPRRPVCALPQR